MFHCQIVQLWPSGSESDDGVVSIVTRLRGLQPENCNSIPDKGKRFILSPDCPDRLLFKGTLEHFPPFKAAGA